jgi:EcsC family protein
MTKTHLPTSHEQDLLARISDSILRIASRVPKSEEHSSATPEQNARAIANQAAARAAVTAGALALPPGPFGWLTVLPEIARVWQIQRQMVADIAKVYGKYGSLNREQMLYCLFRHAASQAVRDLVVRVGERYLVKKASIEVITAVARRIGVRVSQRAATSAVSRWIPIAGAVGIGAYAYYDTAQVARTAMKLFAHDTEPE